LEALALKRDSSATSKTLPQRGHFGRLRFSLAKNRVAARGATRVATCGEKAWHADWTIIVDPPRRILTVPYDADTARRLWHDRNGGVKLSWLLQRTVGT
jgi:hypothetical protein